MKKILFLLLFTTSVDAEDSNGLLNIAYGWVANYINKNTPQFIDIAHNDRISKAIADLPASANWDEIKKNSTSLQMTERAHLIQGVPFKCNNPNLFEMNEFHRELSREFLKLQDSEISLKKSLKKSLKLTKKTHQRELDKVENFYDGINVLTNAFFIFMTARSISKGVIVSAKQTFDSTLYLAGLTKALSQPAMLIKGYSAISGLTGVISLGGRQKVKRQSREEAAAAMDKFFIELEESTDLKDIKNQTSDLGDQVFFSYDKIEAEILRWLTEHQKTAMNNQSKWMMLEQAIIIRLDLHQWMLELLASKLKSTRERCAPRQFDESSATESASESAER